MEAKFELAKELIIILLGMLGFSEPNSTVNIQEEILSVPGYQIMRTYTADVVDDGYVVFFGSDGNRLPLMDVSRGETDYSLVVSNFAGDVNSEDRVSIRAEIDFLKLMPNVDFEKFKEGGEIEMGGENEVFKTSKKDGTLFLTTPDGEKFAFSENSN